MAMTTLLTFSGIEGQRSWPLAHLPSRCGIRTTIPHPSFPQRPLPPALPPSRRGMGMAMTTLLTFSGIGRQRSWPLSHLAFQCGMMMTMTPLLFSSRGERGRNHSLLPCFVPSRRGRVNEMIAILTFSGVDGQRSCPLSFSMWDEVGHGPSALFLKRREAETMASCPPSF